jgi:hypothetical protein
VGFEGLKEACNGRGVCRLRLAIDECDLLSPITLYKVVGVPLTLQTMVDSRNDHRNALGPMTLEFQQRGCVREAGDLS